MPNFDAEKAWSENIIATHVCAVQGHSMHISLRNLPGVWARDVDIGDEIWHGIRRTLLPSIWEEGLRPSGNRQTEWGREVGSRTNHFALTRPGNLADDNAYHIRENSNCAIQVDPAFIIATEQRSGSYLWKKTAAECLLSHLSA